MVVVTKELTRLSSCGNAGTTCSELQECTELPTKVGMKENCASNSTDASLVGTASTEPLNVTPGNELSFGYIVEGKLDSRREETAIGIFSRRKYHKLIGRMHND